VVNPSFAAPPVINYLFPAGAQRGTTVEVTASGNFERWPVQCWASGHGVEAKAAADKSKLMVTVAPDATLGTYYLRLYDDQGASGLRPFLVGTLPEVREQEPNDDARKPQALPGSSVTVNGRLEKNGDVDCFAVPLRQGQILVASLEAHATLRSPMDGLLQVLSADGFVLAHGDDDHGLDPRVVFPVPKDGTYVVRTFAFPATPDASIRFAGGDTFIYRLTLTTGGFADYPFPLAVARSAPGEIELVGWNLPGAAKKLPVPVEGNEDSATLSHPALANTVPVRLEPHPCLVKPSGGAGKSEPFALAPPIAVSGRLDRPRATDTYRIAAKKGQPLHFRLDSKSLGLPLTAVLRLTDEASQQLATAEAKALDKDPELTFTPPQDGPVLLTVRDLHRGGGPRYAYRLRVTPPEPDFVLSVKADRFTLTPGQPLRVPVTVERKNGLQSEIDLTVEGLAPGVETRTLPTDPKSPAQSVIEFSTGDGGPSSAFRIVGKSRGQPGLTHTATVAVAELGTTTSDLWLTVTKPPAKPTAADLSTLFPLPFPAP
jgi:hypothetical protein